MQKLLRSSNDSVPPIKKIIFILVFFLITPITLGTSFISLVTLANSDERESESTQRQTYFKTPGAQVYASLPNSLPSVSGEVGAADSRIGRLKFFLTKHDSTLLPYASYIVEVSEKYGLDYRLTTAIAQKESGLCNAIPEGSNNCWGWGIHSAGTLYFDSLPEGIETVSKGLKNYYIDLGYSSVEEIMAKYAHPSSTTWADGVRQYMEEIEPTL